MAWQGGRRIHVIGGPGSGKTTLAKQAALLLDVPFYELDAVGYEGGSGAERPLPLRIAEIRQIAAQPGWVTEGVFLGWTHALFETADEIVWLDLPWRLVGWRIFLRHVKAELRGNNRHSGWRKLFHFMLWARAYYTRSAAPGEAVIVEEDGDETRAITAQYLTAYSSRLVRCQTPAEIQAYLESLPRPD